MQDLEPLIVAKLLAKVSDRVKPDMVLMGKQAIDGDFGLTGALLAGETHATRAARSAGVPGVCAGGRSAPEVAPGAVCIQDHAHEGQQGARLLMPGDAR